MIIVNQRVLIKHESNCPSQLWGKVGTVIQANIASYHRRKPVHVIDFDFPVNSSWGNRVGVRGYYFYEDELEDFFITACIKAMEQE